MGNTQRVRSSLVSTRAALVVALAAVPWMSGCTDVGARQVLNRGYDELGAKQYDQADSDAEEFLRSHPNGAGVGEAYYLKGRIEEQKAQDPQQSRSVADKRDHLDRARDLYEDGLRTPAPTGVKALLHTGIANVDYHEEDYASALTEWQTAYDNLQDESQKARVLYQIGRCQQRLGMFAAADATYSKVQQMYPGTDAARYAADKAGASGFYVEVGKYPDAAVAEKDASRLRQQGFPASRDARNQFVQIGPYATYVEAKAVKTRISDKFPGSVISP